MKTGTVDGGQSHAALEASTRFPKARKIEALLRLDDRHGPLRLLEVGTGSGWIAHYFASHPSGRFTVDAVDVVDARQVHAGYRYQDVAGTRLPFADASFDVVVSNHVIEHVGDERDQLAHLAELRRVLRAGGIGYLAVPNRWMLVEPHFRLPLLSWLPASLADRYVRVAGKGTHYDCRPLRLPQLERMLAASGLRAANVCVAALRSTLDIERPGSLPQRLLTRVPDGLLEPWRAAIPTLIYRIERDDAAASR